jgi:UDP-N-acetylglucosamine--N-acetylmuramyl-(pentapeptide) pyrophosphoryl-undecaprenol N-acetylglucosamine transferase
LAKKETFNSPLWQRGAGGDFNNTDLKLLVIGGSQGAKILTETLPAALALLSNPLHVMHQTGEAMQNQVAQGYQRLGIQADVQAFITDMVVAYSWADMIICRAGAMTVSEVAAMGLPAIFVPLPSAIDDHQNANARYLSDAGAAVILEQKNLSPNHLAEQIQNVMKQLSTLSDAAKSCARLDATLAVATICIEAATSSTTPP